MYNNKINFGFMAFAKGSDSTTEVFKRYIGIAPVYVIGVCPNTKVLEKIYGRSIEKEVTYTGETEVNGETVKTARVDFIIKTDVEDCGVDIISKVSFFLRNQYRLNRDNTKVQVIDKYGRTAWVTVEQAKKHEIPVYGNGKLANIDKDYRPCFVGEEELTNFIKTYLNIPNVMKYINNEWVISDHPEDSEARLENIIKFFKGDFSEIETAIALQPKNKVKILFGVRTTDDNKQYQDVFTPMVVSNRVTDYSKLEKAVTEKKLNNMYQRTEFEICDIKEYTPTPTEFKAVQTTINPFDENENSNESYNPFNNSDNDVDSEGNLPF